VLAGSGRACRRMWPSSWTATAVGRSDANLPRVGPVIEPASSLLRVAVETCSAARTPEPERSTLFQRKLEAAEVRSRYALASADLLLEREVSAPDGEQHPHAHIGRAEALPEKVQRELAEAIQITSSNTGMILNLAINYGGRTENCGRP